MLGAAISVHRGLGPGLLESVYEGALRIELEERHLRSEHQVPIEATYRGKALGMGFRADLVVEGKVLLELKSTETWTPTT